MGYGRASAMVFATMKTLTISRRQPEVRIFVAQLKNARPVGFPSCLRSPIRGTDQVLASRHFLPTAGRGYARCMAARPKPERSVRQFLYVSFDFLVRNEVPTYIFDHWKSLSMVRPPLLAVFAVL